MSELLWNRPSRLCREASNEYLLFENRFGQHQRHQFGGSSNRISSIWKIVCGTILCWESWIHTTNIFCLKWVFLLPHRLFDNIFYLKTVHHTIVFWELWVNMCKCTQIHEYLLFEMVFSASPLIFLHHLLLKNGSSHHGVLRILGSYG